MEGYKNVVKNSCLADEGRSERKKWEAVRNLKYLWHI